MNQIFQYLINLFKNKLNKKTPGTSSIELIFFVLTCSVLFFFSLETYKLVQNFHGKYQTIVKKKTDKLNKELELLEKQMENNE